MLVTTLALAGASAARAADPVRIGLAVPNQSLYTAVFAARDLGYFKDANVDVEITEFRGGSAAQEALVAGASDLITSYPPGAALASSKGAKEKLIAAIAPASNGWYLIVEPNSPIRTVKDLAGKKVGISTKGSTTDLYAEWAANQAGITIRSIPVGGGGLIPALKAQQVDAVVVFSPLSFKLLSTNSGRIIVDYAKELPLTLPECWTASQDVIEKRPNDVRAVLSGFYRSVKYLQGHKVRSDCLPEKIHKARRREDSRPAVREQHHEDVDRRRHQGAVGGGRLGHDCQDVSGIQSVQAERPVCRSVLSGDSELRRCRQTAQRLGWCRHASWACWRSSRVCGKCRAAPDG